MSLLADIERLKELIAPKRTLRFTLDAKECDDNPTTIWVVFTI